LYQEEQPDGIDPFNSKAAKANVHGTMRNKPEVECMTTITKRAIAPLIIGLTVACHPVLAASSPTGIWLDHTGRGAVEITDCGGKLCGHIVWLKDAANIGTCGLQVIGNVKPMTGGRWDGGWIYDPEKNSKYDVEITQQHDQKLKVMGYAGVKFLSETMIWTRAPADLQRCGSDLSRAPLDPVPEATLEKKGLPAATLTAQAPELPASQESKPGRRDTAAAYGEQKDCTVRLPFVVITIPCVD
jgi:uncharacterized protein (DUF2147 family)